MSKLGQINGPHSSGLMREFSDQKSGEGYTFRLFGGLTNWASRTQATVTTSTTEVELLSLLNAGKELL